MESVRTKYSIYIRQSESLIGIYNYYYKSITIEDLLDFWSIVYDKGVSTVLLLVRNAP